VHIILHNGGLDKFLRFYYYISRTKTLIVDGSVRCSQNVLFFVGGLMKNSKLPMLNVGQSVQIQDAGTTITGAKFADNWTENIKDDKSEVRVPSTMVLPTNEGNLPIAVQSLMRETMHSKEINFTAHTVFGYDDKGVIPSDQYLLQGSFNLDSRIGKATRTK